MILRAAGRGLSIVICIVGVTTLGGACARAGPHPDLPLRGGAASTRELLELMVQALNAKDRGALEALRVSEDEYRQVIIPGHVEPGEEPQRIGDEAAEYFWDVLDTRSRYFAGGLVAQYGGRNLEVVDWNFLKGAREHAGYTASEQLALEVRDGASVVEVIESGSVVEVGGRFKFVSFIRD